MSRDGYMRASLPPELGAVVVGSFELRFGQRLAPHAHAEHQLAWSESGILAVTIDERTWLLPPSRALFIPAERVHSVEASSPAMMRSVYFRKRRAPIRWSTPTVVAITPLLRELIRTLALSTASARSEVHARRLLGSLLTPLKTAKLDLPVPRDSRARRVTDLLTRNVADARSLAELGKVAGASARTLARLFVNETGLTFGQWRSQLRLRAALAQLAEGRTVAEVAGRVGYESPSAFVASFKRQMGVPPGTYMTSPGE